jgi:hypothetical protein
VKGTNTTPAGFIGRHIQLFPELHAFASVQNLRQTFFPDITNGFMKKTGPAHHPSIHGYHA